MADAGLQIRCPPVRLGIGEPSVRNKSQRQVGISWHWTSSRWVRWGREIRHAGGVRQKAGKQAWVMRGFTWVKPTITGTCLPLCPEVGKAPAVAGRRARHVVVPRLSQWDRDGRLVHNFSLVSGTVALVALGDLLPTALEISQPCPRVT